MAREFAFADAGAVLADAFEGALPPERITVADHAAARRWVRSPQGAHLERWDHRTAPYLTEPMAVWTEEGFHTVCVVGPAACGKTMIAENVLLHAIDADPGPLLWYLHTEDARSTYVKGRIEPMLEDHEHLIGRKRFGRDSQDFKRFRGGRMEFLAFTSASLINKHVRFIIADEIDSYEEALGEPLALLNPRRQAAGTASRLLTISHPDRGLPLSAPRERQRGIMGVFADSDRRLWWWPCPHCGGWSSPTPGAPREMVLTYPEDASLDRIETEARLLCPCCGGLIDDRERRQMLQHGRWVAMGEHIDEDGTVTGYRATRQIAGFWITGLMSPFVMGGIGGLAKALETAKRGVEAGGGDGALRQVYVKGFGFPYTPPRAVGQLEATEIADRAEPGLTLGMVPEGVRVLVTSVDTQANRFELLTRGYGEGLESWVIDHRVIPASPASEEEDWDRLLDLLAGLEYPIADGSGRLMRVRCSVFDAVGQDGVTAQAYAAWRRAKRRGKVRRVGRIAGRDVWNVIPARGASMLTAPALNLAYGDGERKNRAASSGRGDVPLAIFNGHTAKDFLAGQLFRSDPGAGTIHFPAALRSPEPPHAWFEQLTAETRDDKGRWTKRAAHLRNEALDLLVMAAVGARLLGLHRIDWEKPPAWAAPYDENALVREPPPPEPPPVAAAPAAPVRVAIPPPGVTVSVSAPTTPARSIASRLA